jgi:hypothetical protein
LPLLQRGLFSRQKTWSSWSVAFNAASCSATAVALPLRLHSGRVAVHQRVHHEARLGFLGLPSLQNQEAVEAWVSLLRSSVWELRWRRVGWFAIERREGETISERFIVNPLRVSPDGGCDRQ